MRDTEHGANTMDDATETCTRCGGTGDLPQFRHIDGGVCYECDGLGLVPAGHVYRGESTSCTQGTPAAPRPCKVIEVHGCRAEVYALKCGTAYRVSLDDGGFLDIDRAAAKAGRIIISRDADGDKIVSDGIEYHPRGTHGAVADLRAALRA